MPGQEIISKKQALLYASDNITSSTFKKGCCSKLCSYLPAIRSKTADDQMSLLLKNDTSAIGYVGLQLMKGKVIVLDNKIDATRNMLVKNKYVVAHTSQVSLRSCRFRNRNGLDRNERDELHDAWNNNPHLGPDFAQMGNMMSQIVSYRDEHLLKKEFK